MTTWARMVDGVAVEVAVQDYPPIRASGSPDKRWKKVKDGISVGHTTPDGGKTWVEPEPTQPEGLEERAAAQETLRLLLSPDEKDPPTAEAVRALARLYAADNPLPEAAAEG